MSKFLKKFIYQLCKWLFAFRRKPIPKHPDKILLLMCNWLGDTFWAMQVIPALRSKYPHAQIYVGSKRVAKDLFYGLVAEGNVWILPNVLSDRTREKWCFYSYRRELRRVRKEQFAMAVDLTGNRYSTLFLTLAKVPFILGGNLHELSPLYHVNSSMENERQQHLAARPWNIVWPLLEQKAPHRLFPPQAKTSWRQVAGQMQIPENKPLALIAPGAGWEEKRWPIDNFAQCAQFLQNKGYTIIISGVENERPLCLYIKDQVAGAIVFIRPLPQLLTLLKHIDIAITNESGIGHLIAAENVRTIAILLDTCKTRGGPIGDKVLHIERQQATPAYVLQQLRSWIT